jgi:hypothetical protein
MKAVPRKLVTRISRNCQQLFSRKAWMPTSRENLRTIGAAFFVRSIELPDGQTLLLSEHGHNALRDLARNIYEAAPLEDLAGYGDYLDACREVLKDCAVRRVVPDSGTEAIELIMRHVEGKIDLFTYVVPLLGIDLKGHKELRLGNFRICRPCADILLELGVEHEEWQLAPALRIHKHYLWLIGTARGTSLMAFDRFRTSADQLTGFLSMYASTTYERGGMRFAFRAATAAEELPNKSTWLHWRQSDKSLGTVWQFVGNQPLEIEGRIAHELERSELLQYCFSLTSKANPTELETAILRAVVWLDDASHERHEAMRLLKLWTCAEVFFSFSRVNVAQAVCDGLFATLTRGPAPLSSENGPSPTELKRLYEKRSRATHGGKHEHVSENDCERMTSWISWMLANFSLLSLNCVPTVEAAREWLGQRSAGLGEGPPVA